MFGYAQWKASPYPVEVSYRRDRAKAGQFLWDCLQAGKTELSGIEMQTLLQAYELQFPQAELARTSKSAVKIAKRLAGSVALKVASPHIEYKSDVGGVELGLQSPEDVRRAFVCSRRGCSGCVGRPSFPGVSFRKWWRENLRRPASACSAIPTSGR